MNETCNCVHYKMRIAELEEAFKGAIAAHKMFAQEGKALRRLIADRDREVAEWKKRFDALLTALADGRPSKETP